MFRALDEKSKHLFLINSSESEGALMKLKYVQVCWCFMTYLQKVNYFHANNNQEYCITLF